MKRSAYLIKKIDFLVDLQKRTILDTVPIFRRFYPTAYRHKKVTNPEASNMCVKVKKGMQKAGLYIKKRYNLSFYTLTFKEHIHIFK